MDGEEKLRNYREYFPRGFIFQKRLEPETLHPKLAALVRENDGLESRE